MPFFVFPLQRMDSDVPTALFELLIVLVMTFFILGLQILHAERRFPAVLLVVVYALIPLLSALPVLSFAVVGYTDAWFGYRTRSART
jgi:RsiW-degrading membrane proteinase PrsW (M82 family)